MYDVIILKEGYTRPEPHGTMRACGTITLLKSPANNIVVDTGNPWDRDIVLSALSAQGLTPADINYIICTSGKLGQTGNLNLFTSAVQLVAGDVCKGDMYQLHGFREVLNMPAVWLEVLTTNCASQNCLTAQKLKVEDIQYVICTHGHSDHCGNLNLFTKAVHIVGFDICRQDQFHLHDFKQGIPYEIDDDVEIWPTPGHTGSDVSVVVKNTNLGTVVISGDLFECEADLENPMLWQTQSERPHLQEQSRIDVLRVADFIIPGHGAMFQVPSEYKKQMRVVMLMEEHYSSPAMKSSHTECIIVETD